MRSPRGSRKTRTRTREGERSGQGVGRKKETKRTRGGSICVLNPLDGLKRQRPVWGDGLTGLRGALDSCLPLCVRRFTRGVRPTISRFECRGKQVRRVKKFMGWFAGAIQAKDARRVALNGLSDGRELLVARENPCGGCRVANSELGYRLLVLSCRVAYLDEIDFKIQIILIP